MAAAQHRDVGDSMAAARRWRQREARQRRTARRQQRGGSSTEAAAVAAARQRNVGGSGTVRECADARAFEVFVLGRGRRDDSVDSIVIAAAADADADDIFC